MCVDIPNTVVYINHVEIGHFLKYRLIDIWALLTVN